MIFSLPDICESNERVAQEFIIQFQVGEDSRFTEESVGVKSEPQAQRVTGPFGGTQSRYGLTTRGLRDWGKI
jgi:hypothetical protein